MLMVLLLDKLVDPTEPILMFVGEMKSAKVIDDLDLLKHLKDIDRKSVV